MAETNTLDEFIEQVNNLRALGENVEGAEQVVGTMTSKMSAKKREGKFQKLIPPTPTPTPTPNAFPSADVSPSQVPLNTIDDYQNKYPMKGI